MVMTIQKQQAINYKFLVEEIAGYLIGRREKKLYHDF